MSNLNNDPNNNQTPNFYSSSNDEQTQYGETVQNYGQEQYNPGPYQAQQDQNSYQNQAPDQYAQGYYDNQQGQKFDQQGYNQTYDQNQYQNYNVQQGQTPYPNQPMQQLPVYQSGQGTAAMVLGIISVSILLLFYFALPCGIIALILGVKVRKEAKDLGMRAPKATAGMVMGIIGTSISVWFLISMIIAFATTPYYYW